MDGSRKNNRISLARAVGFHGHLGPYLILGLLAGDLALKKLGCKKYFGLKVRVWGANQKPKSCLLDGLQLSTGATYGKGNIIKLSGSVIKMEFSHCASNKKIILRLKEDLIKRLNAVKIHQDSESLAKRLSKSNNLDLFHCISNF